jgi:hypothetical protein
VESGESPRSNILRRFPGLANRYTPRRSYARRPAQEEVFGEPAVSPRGPMATTATTATATRLDSVGSRRREDERRKNGPMAEARQNLLLNRDSTWSALSPRTMQGSTGSPRSRPAFAPCNPSQAKASIARPRDVLVGAACPYGSVHDAITDAKRVHEHRMVGGPFVPSSGLSTARSLIANPVTLLSKDAPTLAYERQLTLERSRTNLAEFNRSYSEYCPHADILWRTPRHWCCYLRAWCLRRLLYCRNGSSQREWATGVILVPIHFVSLPIKLCVLFLD